MLFGVHRLENDFCTTDKSYRNIDRYEYFDGHENGTIKLYDWEFLKNFGILPKYE